MTGDPWPLTIDGDDYHPIPAAWIDQGADWYEGDVRLFAVSAALRTGGRSLHVRYSHPQAPFVLHGWSSAVAADADEAAIEGRRPASLPAGDWPRSTVPDRDPEDRRRGPEARLLRALWGDRVDAVPTDDDDRRTIRADGGPVVDFGGGR